MAIRKFSKIELIGLKSEKVRIMETLMDLGVVHPIESEEQFTETGDEKLLDTLSKLEAIYENVKPFAEGGSPLAGEKIIVAKSEMKANIMTPSEIDGLFEKIKEHLNEERAKAVEINTLRHYIENLTPFCELTFPLENIGNTLNTTSKVFSSGSRTDELKTALENIPASLLIKTGTSQFKDNFIFICENSAKKPAEEIMSKFEVEYADIKNLKGIPCEEMEKARKTADELTAALEEEKDVLKKYADSLDRVKKAIDHYENENRKLSILAGLPQSGSTFYIKGWVPGDQAAKTEKALADKYGDSIFVRFSDPEPGEDIPVAYKNSAFVEFYESITDMYSKPAYGEMDPTPYLALFFTFFFGFCLTDAGYGLLITLGAGFIIFNKRTKKLLGNGIKTIYVFFFSGILAIVMGVITGSFFGITLPEAVRTVVPLDLSIDNLGQTAIPFLKLSIYIGALQVAVGYTVNIINQIKKGNTVMGLLQNVPYLVMIISGIKLVALVMGSKVNASIWAPLFLGAVLCNLLFAAPESKGIKRLMKGAYSALFGITGLLGDILSYMRLFALGLSTGILIFVINTVAGVLVELLGIWGYIPAVILIVVSHSINLALNMLGAFVHSLRLQFVEFFQKFYEGGGESYEPIRNDYRFIVMDDNK